MRIITLLLAIKPCCIVFFTFTHISCLILSRTCTTIFKPIVTTICSVGIKYKGIKYCEALFLVDYHSLIDEFIFSIECISICEKQQFFVLQEHAYVHFSPRKNVFAISIYKSFKPHAYNVRGFDIKREKGKVHD